MPTAKICKAPSHTDCDVNNHWTPYITRCGYCATKYSVVVQLDSLEEDLLHVGKMAGGLNFKAKSKSKIKNHSSGESTSSLTKKWFRGLERSLVMKLYKFYQVDFELFGYTLDDYLTL